MKKWISVLAIVVFGVIAYAGETTIRSVYFSKKQTFKQKETFIILKNATVSSNKKTYTIADTKNVILNYTVPAGTTYYSTIIVGGELK